MPVLGLDILLIVGRQVRTAWNKYIDRPGR